MQYKQESDFCVVDRLEPSANQMTPKLVPTQPRMPSKAY